MHSTQRLRVAAGVAAVAAVVSSFAILKPSPREIVAPHPEPLSEKLEQQERLEIRNAPMTAGALRVAIEQKRALQVAHGKLAQAAGHWQPYGNGSLITDDPRFGLGALGITENSARVDAFDYDPVNKRLFAAIGTGGIWMSTDLADHWTAIGDNLPTLSNSAVAWTPAGGGTIVVGSGENTVGSSWKSGLGAFWSTDLGASWNQATGIPDGAASFKAVVDGSRPEIVYIATSKGLFRSEDAGRSYRNVALPTTQDCAGDTSIGNNCQLTNIVTGVAVQAPGGSTNVACGADGCPVIAAVGYFLGPIFTYPDGTTPRAPGNGLYKSTSGKAGTFAKLDVSAANDASPIGFAPAVRMGRMTFGVASGDAQDHNYLYALVQDAQLIIGGIPSIDVPSDPSGLPTPLLDSSVFNGIYASADFGDSWIRMADNPEIALNPATGSSLSVPTPLTTLGYQPGVQAWYNQWILPDPTQTLAGIPTRLVFGLEEMWKNRVTGVPLDGIAQSGPDDFSVFGTYFAGNTCLFLNDPVPVCPTNNPPISSTTTHPDQHAGIFVPDDSGGVCLIVGNDGGVYKQCVAAGEDFDNSKWGRSANTGFYATLPYDLATAKDGVVWFGLQDNGTGKIEPSNDYKLFEAYGGDGFYVAVDPDNSQVAYAETGGAAMRYTTDGGSNWTSNAPPITAGDFSNPFKMDPTDAKHIITGGPEIVELVDAPSANWIQVFSVGNDPVKNAARTVTNLAVRGDAAYAACAYLSSYFFNNCLATNVGGDKPPKKGSGDGWHMATMSGLPNRYLTSVEMDPSDPSTIYVTLGGYLTNANPPGGVQDTNTNIGVGNVYKSTDAGEHFHNISGDLPIGTVNWAIVRKQQLIVGSDIGTYISADLEGSKWAVLGDLPNVAVSMLELKPDDDKTLLAATYGLGVWTYHFDQEIDLGGGNGGTPAVSGGDTTRFGGALPLGAILVLAGAAALRRRKALT